jgi:sporulation protein YlmC with PRC-barrel domain
MRVDLDAAVWTRDGERAGHVRRAVVDPQTGQVTRFVVSTGGLLGKDVLIPRAELEQASPEGDVLRLRLSKNELDELPAYVPTDYDVPPTGWVPPPGYLFPPEGFLWPLARPVKVAPAAREPSEASPDVLIDKGTAVVDRSGNEVGVVEDVLLEAASARLEALVIRLGGPLRTLLPGGDQLRVGGELIESVEPDSVRLRVESEELEAHRSG